MIDLDSALNDFCSISGLSKEESSQYINIINLAIDYVLQNLKPGVDFDKNRNLLSMLVAAIAYHKYVLIKESLNNNSSVKLGDISVSSNSNTNVKIAYNLKKEFTSLASHLLLSPNFIFRGI